MFDLGRLNGSLYGLGEYEKGNEHQEETIDKTGQDFSTNVTGIINQNQTSILGQPRTYPNVNLSSALHLVTNDATKPAINAVQSKNM